jgi:hypothetical protein
MLDSEYHATVKNVYYFKCSEKLIKLRETLCQTHTSSSRIRLLSSYKHNAQVLRITTETNSLQVCLRVT